MKTINKIALVGALTALSSQSVANVLKAEDRNMWALGGVSMASTTVEWTDGFEWYKTRESGVGLDSVFGWKFAENLGVEAGFNYHSISDQYADLNVYTFSIAPAAMFKPNDNTTLILKAGFTHHELALDWGGVVYDLGSDSGMIFGAAAQFTLDYGFTIRAGYDYYTNSDLGDVGSLNVLAGYAW